MIKKLLLVIAILSFPLFVYSQAVYVPTPGGSNLQIQFNDDSSFGGTNFTWSAVTNTITGTNLDLNSSLTVTNLTFSQDNITSNTNKIGLGNTGAKWTVETKDVWGGTFPILAPNSSLGGYGIIEGGIYVMNPDGVSTTAIGLYNQAGTNYWQFETDTSSGSANLDLFTSSTGSFNIANNILANGKLSVGNAAASAGVLTLLEDNDAGSNYASFQVPALAANTVYTLPSDDGDAGEQLQTDGAGALTWEAAGGAGGGAPTNADYLVGTANGDLSAEIVVGTTPGGSLGGTWGTPTIDDLFLKNDASDTTSGTITAAGFTTTSAGIVTANQVIPVGASPTIGDTDARWFNIFSSGLDVVGDIVVTGVNTATVGDAAANFFGAGVTAVTDATTCTDIEGRSLTVTTSVLNADSELYTDFKGITIESPTDADNFFMFEAPFALTITRIMGIVESATAAVLTAQECDSAGDNCVTIEGLSADVDGAITTGGDIDNPAIDAGDIIRCDVGAVVGTVGQAHLTITFTKND